MIKFLVFSMVFFTSLFSFSTDLKDVKLDLNDVSILFPLPKLGDWNYIPSASSTGDNGTLLPLDIVTQIPQLSPLVTNEEIYPSLHAVGVRIDPCFTEGHGPIKCQTQIRLVWQPLSNASKDTATFDVSLHTFYQLTEVEFKSLVTQIKKLKLDLNLKADFRAPLSINPIIKENGFTGEYYTRLIKIIYSFIGESNFSRVTFMQLSMGGNVWTFGGFDIADGKLEPIKIPRIGTTKQIFRNSAFPRPIWFIGGIVPEPTDKENLNIIARDSRKLSPQDEDAIIEAAKSAFKFENPKLHNPGTVDCVSCHVAQPAKIWALRQYPWLQLDNISRDYIYTSTINLRNTSPMQMHTNIVRAFGYFMDIPFVAQRTINESAEVVNSINDTY